jgi:hypothetical protein
VDLTHPPCSRKNRTTTPRGGQCTPCQPYVSLKRKSTIIWKRVSQAVRPTERLSFIPPGFILVARSAKRTAENKARKEAEKETNGLLVKTRLQRLKMAFCFKGWSVPGILFSGFAVHTGVICMKRVLSCNSITYSIGLPFSVPNYTGGVTFTQVVPA